MTQEQVVCEQGYFATAGISGASITIKCQYLSIFKLKEGLVKDINFYYNKRQINN